MDKKIDQPAPGTPGTKIGLSGIEMESLRFGLSLKITGIEMERLRLLAMNPDHPHAVFLFTVERNKDKRR